uniref:Abnormal cell migration protein 18-like fibronectin type I domain-containing protein n=1 Tax=Ditylenchus dipsaci TaxID=166011 RepID=A0A915DPE7_9BILA
MASTRFYLLFVILSAALINQIHCLGTCTHNGKTYKNGEEYSYGSFIMRCDVSPRHWETKVVACKSLMDEKIPVGGQRRDRHGLWKCVQDPDTGSVKLTQH